LAAIGPTGSGSSGLPERSRMRFAVLSDIHGNLFALEAVIADLRAHAPDMVVNLGDHLSGPLQAAATADLLMSQRDWLHIRGNHDRQLIECEPGAMGPSDRAAHERLTEDHRMWLRSLLPATAIDGGVLLCHGTPESDLDYLLEDVTATGVSLASRDKIRSGVRPTAKATFCGHSHVPRFVRLEDGIVVANPGSVGLQAYYDSEHRFPHAIETGSPHARYLLLDRDGGHWRPTFRVIDYDWDAAAQLARSGQRPDWVHALLTGYALR
jgi:predicted phosphodiesterase